MAVWLYLRRLLIAIFVLLFVYVLYRLQLVETDSSLQPVLKAEDKMTIQQPKKFVAADVLFHREIQHDYLVAGYNGCGYFQGAVTALQEISRRVPRVNITVKAFPRSEYFNWLANQTKV